MKKIPLNKGKFAFVDDNDFDTLNQYQWRFIKSRNTFYAVRHVGVGGTENFKTIRMHREIMNPSKNEIIDHIDHDGLNNQKSNLRICVQTENKRNRSAYGTSKYLGVSLHKQKVKQNCKKIWQANMMHDKKLIYIGIFETEEEAAKAYDVKAKELHGEFANLNFK